jgi:hypothetical protein
MRTGIALIFAAAISLAPAAQADDCRLTQMSSLPMQTDRDGDLVVPVTINGTPQRMAVEIGSSFGEVTTRAAEALQLKLYPISQSRSVYFETGEKPKSYASIESFSLGLEHASYIDFVVDPPSPGDDDSVAGIIGHNVLRHYDLDFDFGGGKFNLFSTDHCPGKVLYWTTADTEAPIRLTQAGAIGVTMSLDGHDVDATLDTRTTTSMTLPEAKTAFGLDERSPGVESTIEGSGAGRHTVYRYRFKTLSLSGITVNNPLVELIPDAVGKQARRDLVDGKMNGYQGNAALATPHLMVGLDVLRHLHLYIATKEEKIYATAADAH